MIHAHEALAAVWRSLGADPAPQVAAARAEDVRIGTLASARVLVSFIGTGLVPFAAWSLVQLGASWRWAALGGLPLAFSPGLVRHSHHEGVFPVGCPCPGLKPVVAARRHAGQGSSGRARPARSLRVRCRLLRQLSLEDPHPCRASPSPSRGPRQSPNEAPRDLVALERCVQVHATHASGAPSSPPPSGRRGPSQLNSLRRMHFHCCPNPSGETRRAGTFVAEAPARSHAGAPALDRTSPLPPARRSSEATWRNRPGPSLGPWSGRSGGDGGIGDEPPYCSPRADAGRDRDRPRIGRRPEPSPLEGGVWIEPRATKSALSVVRSARGRGRAGRAGAAAGGPDGDR